MEGPSAYGAPRRVPTWKNVVMRTLLAGSCTIMLLFAVAFASERGQAPPASLRAGTVKKPSEGACFQPRVRRAYFLTPQTRARVGPEASRGAGRAGSRLVEPAAPHRWPVSEGAHRSGQNRVQSLLPSVRAAVPVQGGPRSCLCACPPEPAPRVQVCAKHFGAMLAREPPRLDSREALAQWLCERHNEVNRRLGKPEFGCDAKVLEERYGDCGCAEGGWAEGPQAATEGSGAWQPSPGPAATDGAGGS